MWLRKIFIAAAVAALLALSPGLAFAQAEGPDRSADARAHAASVSSGLHVTGGPTITELPPGIVQTTDGGASVPPGLDRRYSPPLSEPVPEPSTEPEPCATTIVMIGGLLYVQDCHGNLMPL